MALVDIFTGYTDNGEPITFSQYEDTSYQPVNERLLPPITNDFQIKLGDGVPIALSEPNEITLGDTNGDARVLTIKSPEWTGAAIGKVL